MPLEADMCRRRRICVEEDEFICTMLILCCEKRVCGIRDEEMDMCHERRVCVMESEFMP